MKRFIKTILLFSLLIIVGYIGIFFYLRAQVSKQISDSSIIVLGDSHTEFLKLPGNTFNRSISGCPYFVHYYFCQDFSEELKGKKVYIAYSFHNLSKLYENRLKNEQLLPNYKDNMLNHTNDFNLINIPHNNIAVANDFTWITLNKVPKLWDYDKERKKNLTKSACGDTASYSLAKKHYLDSRYVLEDKVQREYLQKIIKLLRNNNCEVILLKMPLTDKYKEIVPSKIKADFNAFAMKNNTEILDLDSILSISDQCNYFKDFDHLNRKGDQLVSTYFSNQQH